MEPSFKRSPDTGINLPHTREEQIHKLAENTEFTDRNFLEKEADKIGMDYDKDTPDEFNNNKNDND
jgi:hypothetical protein